MNKFKAIIIIIGVTIAAYILVLVIIPTYVELVNAANVTMGATSNMSNYFGVQEVTVSTPWVMFFLPGAVGLAALVMVMRMP